MEKDLLTALFFVLIATAALLVFRINRLTDEIRDLKKNGVDINQHIEAEYTIPEETILRIVALVLQTLIGEKYKKQKTISKDET